jgi:hypothetical protein
MWLIDYRTQLVEFPRFSSPKKLVTTKLATARPRQGFELWTRGAGSSQVRDDDIRLVVELDVGALFEQGRFLWVRVKAGLPERKFTLGFSKSVFFRGFWGP